MARKNYHWAKVIAKLRRRPGTWSMEFGDVPHHVLRTVRLKRHPDLRVPDGQLVAEMLETYVDDDGTRRGNLWLRFELYQHNPTDTIGESHVQTDQRLDGS